MNRQIKSHAILLKSERFSESHKKCLFFLPDHGVVSVFAHGAMKNNSRLSGRTELFSFSRVEIYFSPVKEFYTLKEIEIIDFFDGIREENERFLCANCWVELVLKTQALGEEQKMFNLLVHALKQISEATPERAKCINLQFFMRFAAIGGIFPNFYHCQICDCDLSVELDFFWDLQAGGGICSRCLKKSLPLIRRDESDYIEKTMRCNLATSLTVVTEKIRLLFLTGCFARWIQNHLNLTLKATEFYLQNRGGLGFNGMD